MKLYKQCKSKKKSKKPLPEFKVEFPASEIKQRSTPVSVSKKPDKKKALPDGELTHEQKQVYNEIKAKNQQRRSALSDQMVRIQMLHRRNSKSMRKSF